MEAGTVCDARSCGARAYKEILLDSGLTLWACNHHAAAWLVDVPAEERFNMEHAVLSGLRVKATMA